jgi:hypothetical protein
MTARTDNGKSKCKSEMRGFFAALRMTNKEQTTKNTEILVAPE